MSTAIATALQRARSVLARRPTSAIHADEPAVARWEQGMRVLCRHANGTELATDMPVELGGDGTQVSPGWLLRAALAACLATRIAMEAAERGVTITRLEVAAASRSDARGLLGMRDPDGEPIVPAPLEVQLQVRIGALKSQGQALEALVRDSQRCSPVSSALQSAVQVQLRIDVDDG